MHHVTVGTDLALLLVLLEERQDAVEKLLCRTEGIIPAPESSHAIKAAIDEALRAKEAGEERVILFNLSGHGHFDMAAYDAYFAGKLEDVELSQSRIDAAIEQLPRVPALS